jgi:nitrile hydratase accessory protein
MAPHMADSAPLDAQSPEDGRTFDAPWQAQAFAIAVRLSGDGHFAWQEWVHVLGEEIARSPGQTGESANETYYRQWLSALERILVAKGLLATGEAAKRAVEWRVAYINTPHGQPVDLAHATCSPTQTTREVSRGMPLTVSPASAWPTS